MIEVSVYRPLRHKGASALILLLASLGVYIVLQNIISMAFGDDTKTIRSGMVKEGVNLLGADWRSGHANYLIIRKKSSKNGRFLVLSIPFWV
jgi:branched-subunit amino acid ABC-type transport system permease component